MAAEPQGLKKMWTLHDPSAYYNRRGKYIVQSSHNGILHGHEKEQALTMHSNVDESPECNVE